MALTCAVGALSGSFSSNRFRGVLIMLGVADLLAGESNVMGLTRAQRQPYRQTIAIDHRMDFARQATA